MVKLSSKALFNLIIFVYGVTWCNYFFITNVISDDNLVKRKEHAQEDTNNAPKKRQCRVIIEDKVDYHYEVIESVVLKYPIPLSEISHCDVANQPIIFEFSLYQNRVEPEKLHLTSYAGWFPYYDKYLKGNVKTRYDGTHAYFGDMISYANYSKSEVDAIITVTCD